MKRVLSFYFLTFIKKFLIFREISIRLPKTMACCDEFLNFGYQLPEDNGNPGWDPEDFTDDFNLRTRNPYAHNLSYDDEILYLISKISSLKRVPFGYITTGCMVVARKNRDLFRITMLNNFKSNDYVKAPMSKFLLLGMPI